MPNAMFLETFPLYRPMEVVIDHVLNKIPKPPIKMHCATCRSDQTFLMINEYYHGRTHANYPSGGEVVLAIYACAGCKNSHRHFLIKIAENRTSVQKIGQFPAWELKGDVNVEKLLGIHKSYVRRGLVCESQGYGIGAFAYYRRIVEETIDTLLDQIAGLLDGQELATYSEALALTKKTRVTADKIDLVKDLLPASLRPDEMNPLKVLHETLSQGLHAESDESCMENAEIVRNIMVFLATQIATAAEAKKSFTSGMRSLLAKKASRT